MQRIQVVCEAVEQSLITARIGVAAEIRLPNGHLVHRGFTALRSAESAIAACDQGSPRIEQHRVVLCEAHLRFQHDPRALALAQIMHGRNASLGEQAGGGRERPVEFEALLTMQYPAVVPTAAGNERGRQQCTRHRGNGAQRCTLEYVRQFISIDRIPAKTHTECIQQAIGFSVRAGLIINLDCHERVVVDGHWSRSRPVSAWSIRFAGFYCAGIGAASWLTMCLQVTTNRQCCRKKLQRCAWLTLPRLPRLPRCRGSTSSTDCIGDGRPAASGARSPMPRPSSSSRRFKANSSASAS